MKIIKFLPVLLGVLASISLFSVQENDELAQRVEGKGGGGGGRTGRGGGMPAPAIQRQSQAGRAPSMSRVNVGPRQMQRPGNSHAQVQQFIHDRPNRGNIPPPNPGSRPFIQRGEGNRPLNQGRGQGGGQAGAQGGIPAGTQRGTPGGTPAGTQGGIQQPNRPPANIQSSLNQYRQNNTLASVHITQQVKNYNPGYGNWFNGNFFAQHGGRALNYLTGYNGWRSAGWSSVNSWLPYDWSYPIYYGDSGTSMALPEDTDSPTDNSNGPVAMNQSPSTDWLPLGVFAAGKNADQAAISNMFVQMALNQQGELSGTYYNSATDETKPLEGMVDAETQQAVWKISDNPDSPIMVTGLYNLTQDAALIQVNFGDGTVQTWTFIRVNQ